MAATLDLPKRVIIALAQAIKHLSAFGIADAFAETQFFSKFTTRAHMLLGANTLINLEIYRNEDDYTERGSLIWVLDRTKTKFGSRLLRNWVARPLVDKRCTFSYPQKRRFVIDNIYLAFYKTELMLCKRSSRVLQRSY
jgi:DNA mismatch repair protein MSH3